LLRQSQRRRQQQSLQIGLGRRELMGRVEEEGVVELMVLHILLIVCFVVGVVVRGLVAVMDELEIQDGSLEFIDSGRL
jgi:flagellar biosynthesis protein FliQ